MAGYWPAYWYRGFIYGTEIARGRDVLELLPSEHLTRNEIAAASRQVECAATAPQRSQGSSRRLPPSSSSTPWVRAVGTRDDSAHWRKP